MKNFIHKVINAMNKLNYSELTMHYFWGNHNEYIR